MPRPKRRDLINENEIQVFRCVQKCVRHCKLLGVNPVTGENCDYRKEWVLNRLNELIDIFAIECLTFAVHHDKVEVIIRTRPDLLKQWKKEEVARRWCDLFPRKPKNGQSEQEALESRIKEITSDKDKVKELRKRLSSISWFMQCFAADIAVKANQEEKCQGRFWSGRFDSLLLLDAEAVLASAVNIDCSASAPPSEQSKALAGIDQRGNKDEQDSVKVTVRLAPIRPRKAGRLYGSDRAYPKNDAQYCEIVKWTRENLSNPSRGRNPSTCSKLMKDINLSPNMWLKVVRDIHEACSTVAGTPDSLKRQLLKVSARDDHAGRAIDPSGVQKPQKVRKFFRMPNNPLAHAS